MSDELSVDDVDDEDDDDELELSSEDLQIQ